MESQIKTPLFVSIPHSGEEIPPEASWLHGLEEIILMGDVDRYVDLLYEPSLITLSIPYVKTLWHRYAADLNRLAEDVDAESVEGNINSPGTHPRGFHWTYNTLGEKILKQPLTPITHQKLIQRVYLPFHQGIQKIYAHLHSLGFHEVYHLDVHSMPSKGTAQHRDPGEARADIVVSDSKGKSSSSQFKDLVTEAYTQEGFRIKYNWPYFGGRLTEQYGKPQEHHHVVQVELNRALYMNEETKQILPDKQKEISNRLGRAIKNIQYGIALF
jgi:N-formylglutamate amidohydrolase